MFSLKKRRLKWSHNGKLPILDANLFFLMLKVGQIDGCLKEIQNIVISMQGTNIEKFWWLLGLQLQLTIQTTPWVGVPREENMKPQLQTISPNRGKRTVEDPNMTKKN